MASIYKALAAAAISRGEVELPDGKTYTVRAMSMAQLIRLEQMQSSTESNAETLPELARMAADCLGADVAVVQQLEADVIGHLIAMARIGVENVMKALSDEQPAGNASAPAAHAPTKSRSTSRSAR